MAANIFMGGHLKSFAPFLSPQEWRKAAGGLGIDHAADEAIPGVARERRKRKRRTAH